METSRDGSFRTFLDAYIAKRELSFRDFCKHVGGVLSPSVLSNLLKKDNNGKYVCGSNISFEVWAKVLTRLDVPEEERHRLLALKLCDDVLRTSKDGKVSDLMKSFLKRFVEGPERRVQLHREESDTLIKAVAQILSALPPRFARRIYLEVYKQAEYLRQCQRAVFSRRNIGKAKDKISLALVEGGH
jgi:hypothetical protein